MKYKNYYKILELKSDRVSDEEIKNAYRRLAKKYHPDINPGDEVASEKFKLVNEAYQVLGNEVSKKKYDRIHNIYRVKDTIEDTKEKINFDGMSDMIGMVFGKKEQSNFENKNKSIPITGEDLESKIDITLEEAFFGTEKKLAFRTVTGDIKNISVKIPKGIRTGEKVRLAKQGKPGKNGGEPGDLYIKIEIMKNDFFEVKGFDLCMNLKLSPWEAALGTEVKIENIDSSILVNVPAGTESGEILRIANSGFWNTSTYGRGDLLLNIQIMVPKELTDTEKLLFEKLEAVSNFKAR